VSEEIEDVRVLQFAKPAPNGAKPIFDRSSGYGQCDHRKGTFMVDVSHNRIRCSSCNEVVESMEVIRQLVSREESKARRDNAAAWHRVYAEEEAEKQAAKTRKAAYATLFRFGVTPEAYAEEYRRKIQLGELELKQDYSKTLPFASEETSAK
jgi:hypothetical protein